MSADKTPIYPHTTGNTSQATNLMMATTQLPPLAPHAASQYLPSTSAVNQTWFPPSPSTPLPPPSLSLRPGPLFSQAGMQPLMAAQSHITINRPQPRRRPPVMSVQSLLQSEPPSPPQPAIPTKGSTRASPRSIPSPGTFSSRLSLQSPRQLPPSRETTEQFHRPNLLSESSYSAGSPIEYPFIQHRGSESSQHSSLTSSSSFAPFRSAQPQQFTASTRSEVQESQ